jgi:hypothetical protein
MTRTIPESDWKVFRQLHPIALNRYCEEVLQDIAQIAGDTKTTPHERHLKIYEARRRHPTGAGRAPFAMREASGQTHARGH